MKWLITARIGGSEGGFGGRELIRSDKAGSEEKQEKGRGRPPFSGRSFCMKRKAAVAERDAIPEQQPEIGMNGGPNRDQYRGLNRQQPSNIEDGVRSKFLKFEE